MATIVNDTVLGRLAATLGASEPAFRLLITILSAYPLSLLHRYTLYGKYLNIQHLFFTVCGLSLGYFNYGLDIFHSVICVVLLYFLLLLCGGTVHSVIISFTFYMSYLLVGYYYTGTESYDIKWSMPHCVLTLRLIGLTYDVYDGHRGESKLSEEQKKTALTHKPSILEIAGHSYFFGGFMVGPQFPMKRYLDFVRGAFPHSGQLPACISAGVIRGGTGCLYLMLFQIAAVYFPDNYILSEAFAIRPFYQRMLLLGIWGKVVLYKYIACWLIAEGSCIMAGLTFNGKDENGNDSWDGCANVEIKKFEGCLTFGEMIQAFNINTNRWLAQYIFKRVKFLGNKLLSQALSLLFLAVWHGLHSGYYVCFLLEFLTMKTERDVGILVSYHPRLVRFLEIPIVKVIKAVVLKTFVTIFMGYCLIAFVLLSYNKWWEAFGTVYFIGHIVWGGWLFVGPLAFALLKPRRAKMQTTKVD